jgi:lipopolysaccharide export system permease protein
MTRIDRYIVFLYFRILVICFLSLAGLLIVVQVFSNLDEFMRYAEERGSLAQVLIEYYGPYTLTIFERLSGLIALLSLLFVIAWLYKTNEFTALMAAGVTKRRVVRPLLVASALVIILAAGLREFAIPIYQDRLDRNPQDLSGEVPRPVKPSFDRRALVLITGRHLLPIKQQIVDPTLRIHQGPLTSKFGRQITASFANYHPAASGKPPGFMLQGITQPNNIDQIESCAALDGTPILLTSKDTDWVPPGECFLVSDIEFEMMRGGSAWKQFASTSELIAHLRSGEKNGADDLRVQIHQRLLRPVFDWTLLLLGMPVLLTRPDRHMFWLAGACLFLVSGFTALNLAMAAVGASGYLLSPSTSIWIPIVACLPWGWVRTSQSMDC